MRAASVAYMIWHEVDGSLRSKMLNALHASLTIGRRRAADVSLADRSVSRLHAVLLRRAGAWLIADGGLSRNGTFVNGVRVADPQRLRNGDRIVMGSTELAYRAGAAPAVTATLASAEKRVLGELARPLAINPRGLPATDTEIASTTKLPIAAVTEIIADLAVRHELTGGRLHVRDQLAMVGLGLCRSNGIDRLRP